ncbi:hypothetical protein AG1IA_02535 [Rhizoctonia solani AG-1 IA]|uniref:Uncharacterized protein n=1 Tax=Thanatephorus cucumeris (strain AG1-IA) TaxID=983506 RepID=L8X344_THACA|nr:hypothetical protein AG1IA_02535 [Rhizoctonia solani AG-1 IA]
MIGVEQRSEGDVVSYPKRGSRYTVCKNEVNSAMAFAGDICYLHPQRFYKPNSLDQARQNGPTNEMRRYRLGNRGQEVAGTGCMRVPRGGNAVTASSIGHALSYHRPSSCPTRSINVERWADKDQSRQCRHRWGRGSGDERGGGWSGWWSGPAG